VVYYVVMEYIPCGELFALWKKLHNFSDSLVRLYVAELGMVLGSCSLLVVFLCYCRHGTVELCTVII